jgi:MFS family permease
MNDPSVAPSRSRRLRELASYPFRLGPPEAKFASTPFGGLAVVNNLSSVGDSLVTVALAGSVFVSVSLSAARGRTALGLLATVLPFAVVGPFVGPFIDRVRGGRRFIVFLAALVRVAACVMMSSWIHSLLLFPAAFLSLVCSKTHAVTKASLVPTVVDSSQDLVKANSRLAVGSAVFTSIAALIGSGIYGLLGSHVLLDLDVAVFAVTAGLSLMLLSGSPHPLPTPSEQAAQKARLPRLPASLVGRVRPPIPRDVTLASVAMAGMRAVAGFLTALVVFGFRRNGAPVVWYGLVAVASVGGNFGGALLAPVVRGRISEKRLVATAAVVIGVTAVATTQMTALKFRLAALVLAAVIGLGASVAKTAFDAIVQRDVPDADRSRMFARFESLFQLAWVVGALFPTLIGISLFSGFVVIACTIITTSAVFVVGVARSRLRPLQAGGSPRSLPATAPDV